MAVEASLKASSDFWFQSDPAIGRVPDHKIVGGFAGRSEKAVADFNDGSGDVLRLLDRFPSPSPPRTLERPRLRKDRFEPANPVRDRFDELAGGQI